ncbi:IS110 family transposase [Streptomyces sp. NPDC054783]
MTIFCGIDWASDHHDIAFIGTEGTLVARAMTADATTGLQQLKKSDHLDAMVLANILRTDAAAHRTLPADAELAQAVADLARVGKTAVWDRTQAADKLRSPPA